MLSGYIEVLGTGRTAAAAHAANDTHSSQELRHRASTRCAKACPQFLCAWRRPLPGAAREAQPRKNGRLLSFCYSWRKSFPTGLSNGTTPTPSCSRWDIQLVLPSADRAAAFEPAASTHSACCAYSSSVCTVQPQGTTSCCQRSPRLFSAASVPSPVPAAGPLPRCRWIGSPHYTS